MNKFITSCVLCVILFVVPVATFVSQKTGTLEGERRRVVAFPHAPKKIAAGEIKRFFREFDVFFADHFPLRGPLLSLSSRLHESTGSDLDMEKCYSGKENWLFLGNNYDRTVDKLQGRAKLSRAALRRHVEYYAGMRSAARSNGADFVVFIGPNKSSVYPEYLPSFVTPANKRFITPLVEALRDAGVKVYDPTERLIRKKAEGILYYRTDTHWNERGAYEAFDGFREYMDLPALPRCTFVAGAELHRGDLVAIGGFEDFPLSKGDSDAPRWDPPLSHSVSEKTAWIFGDSFAGALGSYMRATFAQTKSFRHEEFGQAMSSQDKKPDIIIWVVVERNFAQAD